MGKDKGKDKKKDKKKSKAGHGDRSAAAADPAAASTPAVAPATATPRPAYASYSQVDPDTLSYLNEVGAHCASLASQAAAEPRGSDAARALLEERALLAANVLEELLPLAKGDKDDDDDNDTSEEAAVVPYTQLERALNAATDAQASRPLEAVLSGAPAAAAARFLGAFASSPDGSALWRLCGSPPGSHVAEKALLALDAGLRAEEEEQEGQQQEQEEGAANVASSQPTARSAASPVLEAMARAVGDALNDYVYDRYATHVARRLLCVAAGRDVLPPRKAAGAGGGAAGDADLSAAANDQPPPPPPAAITTTTQSGLAEKLRGDFAGVGGGTRALASSRTATTTCRFPALVRRLASQLLSAGLGEDGAQLLAMARDPCSGAYVQAVLRAARCLPEEEGGPDLVRRLVPRVLGAPLSSLGGGEADAEGDDEEKKQEEASTAKKLLTPSTHYLKGLREGHVGKLLRDPCVSRLAEAALAASPADLSDEFYARFLQNRLIALTSHHCANFAVQAALGAASTKTTVSAMHDELAPVLGDLLQRRRSGVAAALVAACARAGVRQVEAAAALRKALVGDEEGNAAMALMELDAPQQGQFDASSSSSKRPPRLSAPGCAALATLLRGFSRSAATSFVRDLASLPAQNAVRAARDPSGSRALEAFFDSPRVPGAAKAQLCLALCPPEASSGGSHHHNNHWHGKSAAASCGWTQIATAPAGAFVVEAAYEGLTLAAASALGGGGGGEGAAAANAGKKNKRRKKHQKSDSEDNTDNTSSSIPQAREALVAALADPAAYAAVARCRWGPRLLRLLGAEAYARSPDEWARRAAADARRRGEWSAVLAAVGGVGVGDGGGEDGAGGQHKESRRQKRRRKREEAIAAAAARGDEVVVEKKSSGSDDDEKDEKEKKEKTKAPPPPALVPASGAEAGALALLMGGEGTGGDEKRNKKKRKKESKA